jgi:CheY-like chemotaxis protein
MGVMGDPPHILVVDDVLENRHLLTDMLHPLGFQVSQAAHGEEALTLMALQSPDLIITDIRMPIMDGPAFIRYLRKLPQFATTPIIIASASNPTQETRLNLALEVKGFILKPIVRQQLLDMLQQQLKLTWRYNQSQLIATASEALLLPPNETISHILTLARRGNILEIKELLAHLAQENTAYQAFINQIQPYTRNYQIQKLCQWLESLSQS